MASSTITTPCAVALMECHIPNRFQFIVASSRTHRSFVCCCRHRCASFVSLDSPNAHKNLQNVAKDSDALICAHNFCCEGTRRELLVSKSGGRFYGCPTLCVPGASSSGV